MPSGASHRTQRREHCLPFPWQARQADAHITHMSYMPLHCDTDLYSLASSRVEVPSLHRTHKQIYRIREQHKHPFSRPPTCHHSTLPVCTRQWLLSLCVKWPLGSPSSPRSLRLPVWTGNFLNTDMHSIQATPHQSHRARCHRGDPPTAHHIRASVGLRLAARR